MSVGRVPPAPDPTSEPTMDEILEEMRRVLREDAEERRQARAVAVADRAVATRPQKIFLSYRRSDTLHLSGRMHDHLSKRFGDGNVFFDVDTIPFGVNFREHISDFLKECAVLLAVIGPNWRNPSWPEGPAVEDLVQTEIEEALATSTLVLPILVDGAVMPASHLLPEKLRPLTIINAPHVSGGRDFLRDIERIMQVIEKSKGGEK